MVIDTLHDVPRHMGIEIGYGQGHELDKEIGDQRDIDPGAQVQQDPTPENIDRGTAQKEHHLCCQHHIDKVDVLVLYAHIHDTLGKEGKDKL